MKNKSLDFILMIIATGKIRTRLILSFLSTAIHIQLLLTQPILIADIIRRISSKFDSSAHFSVFLLASAMTFSAVMAYMVATFNNSMLQDIRRGTKYQLYLNILKKPCNFFQNFNEGSIESAIATASLAARTIIHDSVGTIIRSVLFVIFSAILISSELPLYGLIFLCAAILYFYLAYILARRSTQSVVSAVAATSNASKEASDLISNIETIQCSDMINHEARRLMSYLNCEREIYKKGQGLIDSNEFFQKIFLTFIFVGFVISVSLAARGDSATAIMLYIIGLLAYGQLDLVGKSLNSMFEQSHKLDAILRKISFNQTYTLDKENSITTIDEKYASTITLDNVYFSYHDNYPLFSNISFNITPGSHHLISGKSGVGKSTLLKIISGQILPTGGRVLLGGIDLFRVPLENKSRLMSIIPQRVTLFKRSIYENSTYGVDGTSYAALEELLLSLKLDRIQCHGEKHWLDLKVDQNSLNLSGGEKQRILLARAILRARPLLFLDESTSALDRETETAVLRVLHERLPHTTIVAVCHHPHAELAGYQTLALT